MTTPAVSATPGIRPPGVSDLLVSDLLEEGLRQARPGAPLTVVSVPVPVGPLEALLDAAPAENAVVWAPPEGERFAAIGAAEVVTGSGLDRFEAVKRRAAQVLGDASRAGAADAPAPRCFGGFSFRPGSADRDPWEEFGDARFVLPRFTYAVCGERAWLSLAVKPEELASESRRRALLASADHLVSGVRAGALRHRAARPRELHDPREVKERVETGLREWHDLVEEARAGIARGEIEKVVVARRTTLVFSEPVTATEVLLELGSSTDRCTCFAFRFGKTAFLGATPERLVRRQGLDVETEALAGSSRSGDPARAADLLHDPKECAEHAPVLREIVASLAPLCTSLDHPETPRIRELRHILHLWTPVHGRLAAPVHVLDLVARLHPTPAVGGVPSPAALSFLERREPLDRGWYASPIGWFDAGGDGEFVVALRSGALVGDRAYLFAGGGIVRDSDPESEFAETRLKLAALSAALRVAR